jgi:hypothetical protein
VNRVTARSLGVVVRGARPSKTCGKGAMRRQCLGYLVNVGKSSGQWLLRLRDCGDAAFESRPTRPFLLRHSLN